MNIELISYFATAPTSAGAAAAAVAGDTLQCRTSRGERSPSILTGWAFNQADGFHQLNWPSSHDQVRGYRPAVFAAQTELLQPPGFFMGINPQETISATIAGSAADGEVEVGCLLMHYPDQQGIDMRMLRGSDAKRMIRTLTTVTQTITPTADAAAGAGVYNETLLTSSTALLKANRNYAVLGCKTSENNCAAVTLRGNDTGGQRIGMPGGEGFPWDGQFFPFLSEKFGDEPLVPVINASNAPGTFLGVITNDGLDAVLVSLILGLLEER